MSYFGSQNVVQYGFINCFVMLRRPTIEFILVCYNRFLSSIALKCIVKTGKVATVRAVEIGSIIYNQMNL
jgi:hypothetical protein